MLSERLFNITVCPSQNVVCGWVSSPNTRGTINIIWSSLSTVWLCTWTALCLNIPEQQNSRGWRMILYKFRWQMFAVFFPEVLVALAAEQWISAKQSVRTFSELGHNGWTIRHGFFADMGGIIVAPKDSDHFAIDSYQLAHLIRNNYISLPPIDINDIRAVNKADGLARAVTMAQMAWFCMACLGRSVEGLNITPVELETLAFILCTTHTFFFWWNKPLDPARPLILPLNETTEELCMPGHDPESFERTPLDFVRPAPDSKSLIAPFWFGLKATFNVPQYLRLSKRPTTAKRARKTIANSTIHPAEGIGWILTLYLIFFQAMFYGLHIGVAWKIPFPTHVEFSIYELANIVDFGLIVMFILALPLGAHFAPFIGRVVFKKEASTVLEVAAMLPPWGKLLVHGPFVIGYIIARVLVLGESVVALRAMPNIIFQDLDWSNFLPHI
ncbi:hypothetical protein BHYA_0035g00140 [Botrytis hyacinthi]|uniref:Uncharacterized protein n=1 Tax=Botrytis hyacinthi TaxID=278943 RepID=A0A4Z1GZN8_9HELO|nr:hypothetical protein BHYA_0035g00140 [Botrytis hyacinthi]